MRQSPCAVRCTWLSFATNRCVARKSACFFSGEEAPSIDQTNTEFKLMKLARV